MIKKLSLLILSIILVFLILSTTTYALFFKQDKLATTEEYTSGILDVVLDNNEEGLGEVLSLSNSIPIEDSVGITTTPYQFKITNRGNVSYSFDLKIISTTVSNEIDNKYIKVMIDEEEPIKLSNIDNKIVKSNLVIPPQDSITISVRIWLDDSMPNTEIGKSFSAKIVTDGIAIEEPMIASEYLIKLSQGNSWSSGANGLYEVTYNDEEGNSLSSSTTYALKSATKEVKDYRYIGSNVNNYIRFNNDLYRIIGIFDENTHGVSGEYLVKIISSDLLFANSYGVVNTDATSGVYSNYYNDWTGKQSVIPANVNILLNQYFLNKNNISNTYGSCSNWTYFYGGADYKTHNCDLIERYGINDTYRNYIETTTWYLNGFGGSSHTANDYYLCERGLNTICTSANNGGGDVLIMGKIGLMYVSDYMYASGYKVKNSPIIAASAANSTQNWMYKGYEWTIMPSSSNNNTVFAVYSGGYLNASNCYSYYSFGIRPTFYLKSNIKIIGGEGTYENPYQIGL